jgi:hypothetical protein
MWRLLMAEKQYKYTAKIKQPQTVVNVKLDPKGGPLSEREYKTLKKDAYGASLLEKGLLVVEEDTATVPAPASGAADDQSAAPAPSNESIGNGTDELIPDFEAGDEKKGRKK